ncbi:MAG: hypothetical protein E6K80_11805 [Candidatus Eisenbacteria bacterium]|uniref:Uncharacterized protein n=1 Tax=Eiseniibacteriota bacterium TaxID=2212470 RepID=A0A538U0J7_UNCEI|nr:MAG: hypothetical protein E6K80_11805 [Candidatus Eisenbacteria bacterium]
MKARDELDSRYLGALVRLNVSLGHHVHGLLGALGLQLGLVREFLKRVDQGDPALVKAADSARKAERSFHELSAAIEAIIAATRPSEREQATLDLRQVLRNAEAVIAPLHRDRRTQLRLQLPAEPVLLEGSRDAIQRALVISLVDASLAIEPGASLDLRLDPDGVLEVEGPPAHQWLPAVTGIIEDVGGGLESSPTGSRVAIRLPVQTQIR